MMGSGWDTMKVSTQHVGGFDQLLVATLKIKHFNELRHLKLLVIE